MMKKLMLVESLQGTVLTGIPVLLCGRQRCADKHGGNGRRGANLAFAFRQCRLEFGLSALAEDRSVPGGNRLPHIRYHENAPGYFSTCDRQTLRPALAGLRGESANSIRPIA
jgi:hypothetical protein